MAIKKGLKATPVFSEGKIKKDFFNQDFDVKIVYWLLGSLIVLFILFLTWRNETAFMSPETTTPTIMNYDELNTQILPLVFTGTLGTVALSTGVYDKEIGFITFVTQVYNTLDVMQQSRFIQAIGRAEATQEDIQLETNKYLEQRKFIVAVP